MLYTKRFLIGDDNGFAVELSIGKQDTRCPTSLYSVRCPGLWRPVVGNTFQGVIPSECVFIDQIANLGWQSEEREGVAGDSGCGSGGDIRPSVASTFGRHFRSTIAEGGVRDFRSKAGSGISSGSVFCVVPPDPWSELRKKSCKSRVVLDTEFVDPALNKAILLEVWDTRNVGRRDWSCGEVLRRADSGLYTPLKCAEIPKEKRFGKELSHKRRTGLNMIQA